MLGSVQVDVGVVAAVAVAAEIRICTVAQVLVSAAKNSLDAKVKASCRCTVGNGKAVSEG